jgi:hypothetical protein
MVSTRYGIDTILNEQRPAAKKPERDDSGGLKDHPAGKTTALHPLAGGWMIGGNQPRTTSHPPCGTGWKPGFSLKIFI